MFSSGSILITDSAYPVLRHFAIVFYDDNSPLVCHITEISIKPEVMKLSDFLRDRKLLDVIPPKDKTISDKEMVGRIIEMQKDGSAYNILNSNCEDFVRYVCDCNPAIDQRSR